jgi:hypothetical protein
MDRVKRFWFVMMVNITSRIFSRYDMMTDINEKLVFAGVDDIMLRKNCICLNSSVNRLFRIMNHGIEKKHINTFINNEIDISIKNLEEIRLVCDSIFERKMNNG